MTTQAAVVNTGKAQRRTLHFDNLEQAIAEGERIAEAERAGTAKHTGNWTAGQILNHVGGWAELAYGGNPIRAPWFVKLFAKPMLRRFLKKGLPAGHGIPGVPGGTLVMEAVPVEQGLARLKAGFMRLKREAPVEKHPLFGVMTHEQWIGLNLRHAELHMSFVKA